MSNPPAGRQDDLLTVASISIVAFALANFLHEAVGHGGACLLVGGKALVLSSMHFQGYVGDPLGWQNKVITAGGTVMNLVAAAIVSFAVQDSPSRSPAWRYFWWLFGVVNLLQATGYFLFSGLLNIGDWGEFIRGFPFPWIWRALLVLVGGTTYFLTVLLGFRRLARWIDAEERAAIRRISRLTVVSYFAGGVLYVVAGLLNPLGIAVVFLSAVAASFGGASGLAWGPQLLWGKRADIPVSAPITIGRSTAWIFAAAIVSLVYVLLLGPGIRLG